MTSNSKRKLLILREYYMEKGFLNLLKFICLNLFVYQKFIIFEKNLLEPVEIEYSKIEINIRLLSRDNADIEKLVMFWPSFYAPLINKHSIIKQMISDRLSMGEECMVAEHNGKIIHMNWIGFKNTYLFNDYVLKKGMVHNEAVGYNIYTVPEYRGNKVVNAVWVEIFNFLLNNNYKKLTHYVALENIASINATSKLFKKVGLLYNVRVLTFGRYFLSKRII